MFDTIDVILSLGLSLGAITYLVHMLDLNHVNEILSTVKNKIMFEIECKSEDDLEKNSLKITKYSLERWCDKCTAITHM